MREPQEIEVEDGEEVVERVAAVDVAKASGKVCTRAPHPSIAGRRITKVWDVGTTTASIMELADELARQGVERVVVEPTSDHWRPFVYLLEARGLVVWLVNARDAKQVPGRPKTDKLDAVRLAKLNERGMLRPSFVPPAEIRQLHDCTRLRADLVEDRTRPGGGPAPLDAVARLDEVSGIGATAAQAIIAEVGLDMSQFPTAGHLVPWARLSPRTVQPGAKNRTGKTGKGNPYLKRALAEAAASVARTDTFLGHLASVLELDHSLLVGSDRPSGVAELPSRTRVGNTLLAHMGAR